MSKQDLRLISNSLALKLRSAFTVCCRNASISGDAGGLMFLDFVIGLLPVLFDKMRGLETSPQGDALQRHGKRKAAILQ